MPAAARPAAARLTGAMIVDGVPQNGEGLAVRAVNPATGSPIDPAYRSASAEQIGSACNAATAAFERLRAAPPEQRAVLLDTIAHEIEALGDHLVDRAHLESGLTRARLDGERDRTTGQLRLFAAVLRDGGWQGVRIDHAQPQRRPTPRPDIRQRRIPLGPVAVFGASNFPLAFSVAGGDTASALAAGCPVVVKAHEAHPGTSEMVGRAVSKAVRAAGLPSGTFGLLSGDGPTVGAALVRDPRICAVGFTGSRRAGLAIVHAAAARPRPIPVFAEMSSVNPVFLLPGALVTRGLELARGYVGSMTLGAGQFCTSPGLVLAIDGPALHAFVAEAAAAVSTCPPATMLTPGIADAYRARVTALRDEPGVRLVSEGSLDSSAKEAADGRPALFTTDATRLLSSTAAQQEVFGACSVVVRCADDHDLLRVAAALEGQLTATVHATELDAPLAGRLLPTLEQRAGRILFNGWPTGVEVGHAMVHGGPFPATSDSRSTSVGSLAIDRFLRPVAYQDVPEALLPTVLADGNPDGIWRLVDGKPTRQ